MADASKIWWEAQQTDWTQGEPRRAVELLAVAYDQPAEIARILGAAGIVHDAPSVTDSPQQAWTRSLDAAARQRRVLDLAAEVLEDPTSAAFHSALEQLLGDRLGLANARRVLRHGLPPAPSTGRDAVVDSLVAVSADAGETPVGGLEAITSAAAGLDDPRAAIQALTDATQRTAMIEVGGRPRGTGFLVGSTLLLTAAHVLHAREWPPSTIIPSDVCAVFDYFEHPGRSAAETGVRVPVTRFLAGSLPTPAEADGSVRDWNAPRERLDFALLELAFEPECSPSGSESRPRRGAYQPESTPYDYAAGPLLLIVQHPLGAFQRLTRIKTAAQLNRNGTRIRYRGNTLQGSSGSAVVDERGRLVALHHYSKDGQNQGVPIAAIAVELENGPYGSQLASGAVNQPVPGAAASADVDMFATTSFMGRPFVNRENLRSLLRVMAETDDRPRTLAISGESGSGVSYSYLFTAQIAKHSKRSPALRAAAPDGLLAFDIDLRNYVNLGVAERSAEILRDVHTGFKLKPSTDEYSQLARNLTRFRQSLKSELRASLHQWWVFVDSIDSTVSVKQGGVDELIHVLIDVADDPQVKLRVVLAGREAEQFAREHQPWLEWDFATGLDRGDVEQWFRKRAAEEGHVINEALLTAKLEAMFPVGGPLPVPRKIAPTLPAALLEVLDGAHGS